MDKNKNEPRVLMLELKVLQLAEFGSVRRCDDVHAASHVQRVYFAQKCTPQIYLIKYYCSKIYTSTPSSGSKREEQRYGKW